MTAPATFFALSTGRSGSQTLAHVLTQAPNCLCLHEPHPQLVKESAQYRYGRMTEGAAVSLLKRTRPHPEASEVYGESNNRLSLMIPALVAAFPEAKFVWLQRDGRDVVASELQRGGYAPESRLPWRVSKWARWRPRADRLGHVSRRTWRSWSRLEKLAWQWDWTHRLIRDDLESLAPGRYRVLQLERLPHDLPEVSRWLGLSAVDFLVERANRRRDHDDLDPAGLSPRHPNLVPRVEGWETWSEAEQRAFESRAGDLMDELYPNWRMADGGWCEAASAAPCHSHPSEIAVMRSQLARARVEHLESRTELADLSRSPARLLWMLAAALWHGRRSDT